MKILLTGSTGFIGKNILEKFNNVQVLNRYDDISLLTYIRPDVIIHCAAEIYNVSSMFSSNILLTHKLLEYCREHKTKFVYIGSSSEYGKTTNSMSEKDGCDPQTLYAGTKACGTLLTQAYSREFKFDSLILRPFSVYGKHEPAHRLIPRLFEAAKTGEHINIIKGEHDFIYIKDFIQALEVLLYTKLPLGTIINIGRGKAYSNLDVVGIIETITSKKINYTASLERKAVDSEIWKSDTTRLLTYYKPIYNLVEGLKDFYEHNIQTN